MQATKFNDMLELTQEKHDQLGEVLVLKASCSEVGCPFETQEVEVEPGEDSTEPNEVTIESVSIRLSDKTALKLAMDILRRLGRV